MNNQDLMFAALVGIENYKTAERLALVQNELLKHVVPPFPFLPYQNNDEIVQENYKNTLFQLDNMADFIPKEQQFFPLGFSFKNSEQIWYFPYEPLVSVSGGASITKANVSRSQESQALVGTLKTRRQTKDFEITITGMLFGGQLRGTPDECYPTKKIQQLLDYIIATQELKVYHQELLYLGITHLVVEDYSFPFTKGENAQAFDLKCVSDFPNQYKLIINK